MKNTLQFLLLSFCIFIFCNLNTLFAQNLIPNGDFELGPDTSSAGWCCLVDSLCNTAGNMAGPDFWSIVFGSPDRMIEGDILCNWDNDTAQSGKSYIVLAYDGPSERGKATLLSPLQKDSFYHLSYYLSLETFRGLGYQPFQIGVNFNYGGNSLLSPFVNIPQWKHFDTIFKASANSTEIELVGFTNNNYSAAKIDNVSLIKVTNTYITNYYTEKNKIIIFPNPSNGKLQIDLNNCNDVDFKIYNSIGEEVNYVFFNKQQNFLLLNLSYLPKGFYYIKFKINEEIDTEKIILTN